MKKNRTIQVGSDALPVMRETLMKVLPIGGGLCRLTQEINTPTTKYSVSALLEQVQSGALFAEGKPLPFISKISSIFDANKPPMAARYNDGTICQNDILVTLSTGDAFGAPETGIEDLADEIVVEYAKSIPASVAPIGNTPPKTAGRKPRWDLDGVHGKILQRWKDARAIKGISVPQFLKENLDVFRGKAVAIREKEMYRLLNAAGKRK